MTDPRGAAEKGISTGRLRLRPLTWGDLPFLVLLHADPRVARYLGTGRPRSEAETREWLEGTITWQNEEQLGHLGVALREDEQLIGRCGLTCMELEQDAPLPRAFWGRGSAPLGVTTSATIELGYSFLPEVWGRGYATEAARRMRDEAFAVRGEPRLISLIRDDNLGSMRVAEKNGLALRGSVDFSGRVFLRYEITRVDWARSSTEP